jgi:hypothetical protein
MKPRIYLVVRRPDGRLSDIKIDGDLVTPDMLDSAEDLVHTITIGERPVLEGLYDLCALAFSTTREDAKERMLAAIYGKRGKAPS